MHCLQLGWHQSDQRCWPDDDERLAVVAQFERDLLIERTRSGLHRAWAEGKRSGRLATLSEDQRSAVRQALDPGETVSALAQQYEMSRQTILRARTG